MALDRFSNPMGPGVLYVRETKAGVWLWTSIAGVRQSTGIRWPEKSVDQREAKRLGMQILRERVDAHYNPSAAPKDSSEKSIAAACALYLESVQAALTEGMQRRYKSVVVHVLHRAAPEFRNAATVSPADPDFPLSYSALLERVEQKISSSPLDRRYLRKLIGLLPKFFDYWVERGWLDRSPANAISAPAARATQEDNRIWEQDAVRAMVV